MSKKQVLGTALAAVIASFAVAGPAQAEARNCSRVGTWFGQAADAGLKWMGNHTPGTSATTGQLSFTWVLADPSFGAKFPVQSLTNGEGIWAKVKDSTYRYTWFAYGMMPVATGYSPPMPASTLVPFYAVRVTGTATMTDCNHMEIAYTAEFMSPDLSTPYYTVSGTAAEVRMPLVSAP